MTITDSQLTGFLNDNIRPQEFTLKSIHSFDVSNDDYALYVQFRVDTKKQTLKVISVDMLTKSCNVVHLTSQQIKYIKEIVVYNIILEL